MWQVTRFVTPARRPASVMARCTADSWRWYPEGGPNLASRQMRAAGKTNCQRHSAVPERAWVDDFVHQLTVFPRGAHDDDVDAFTQLVLRLMEPRVSLIW